MPNRRDFLAGALALGGACTFPGGRTPATEKSSLPAKTLHFLILGGTGNIGPYFVRAALARGTTFPSLVEDIPSPTCPLRWNAW